MKTIKSDVWRVTSGEMHATGVECLRHPLPVTRHVSAFTLIELLVVISIIAILAALILPVAGAVRRRAYIQTAQAEMAQIETAIARYHSAYGFYPPCNTNNPMVNPLYFELVGTTNENNTTYQTLDGSATIRASDVSKAFDETIGGFINCNKPNADESAPQAQDFLPDLRPNQYNLRITNQDVQITLLVTADGGPDQNYSPLGSAAGVNPWRYLYPGVNNPNSYDLWVQLVFKPGETNLICNWSKQVQVNNPLP